MNEVDKEIAEKYNLEIKSIVPLKDVFIISTSKGKMILKKTILSPERIQFIHAVKEHLSENNFTRLDRFLCSTEGIPYLISGGDSYTLTNMIEGNECNFDNRTEIIKSARLLAEMHKASKGFRPPENCIPRDELGKLPLYFNKRLEEIKKLKKTALKEKNRFDYMFLQHYDYFHNLGENAIGLITNSIYDRLVKTAKEEGVLCHHDFTHNNIISNGSELYIINFDYCCFELKVYDIANFLRRKMRKCNWDINEAKVIIDEYRTIEDISEDEFFVMKLILQFPQKFWRVINKYYNSKRGWSEKSFIVKLQEVIDEIEYHKKFLEKFDTLK